MTMILHDIMRCYVKLSNDKVIKVCQVEEVHIMWFLKIKKKLKIKNNLPSIGENQRYRIYYNVIEHKIL